MQPPPPRYRIVERSGRLIVTDLWAKGRPARPEAPPAAMAGAPRPVRPAAPRPTRPGPTPAKPGANPIDALGGILVRAICKGSIDSDGRPTLSTTNHYDAQGPRDIVLSPAGERRLGRWLVALLSVALFLLFALATGFDSFIMMFVVIGVVGFAVSNANTTARPAITRWLDRLERD